MGNVREMNISFFMIAEKNKFPKKYSHFYNIYRYIENVR